MGILFLISTIAFSQGDDFNFLKSAPADGVKFFQAYFKPYANAFGAGLNGGWYNTARPHKILGFDITASVNAGIVPLSENTFDVTKIGLVSLTGTGMASTIAGPNKNGPQLLYKTGVPANPTVPAFTTPPGVDWKYVPAPTVQLGIGLPFKTEVKLRFLPKIAIGDGGDVSLYGVGVMHSIIQYLPGAKMIKLFDVSAFAGYTKITGNMPLDVKPDVATSRFTNINSAIAFNNQFLSLGVSALNFGVIGSITVPVLTLYGGVGYAKSSMDIKLKGNFPTPTYNSTYSTTTSVYEDKGVYGEGGKIGIDPTKQITVTSFPSIEFKNLSGLRANIGLRIKLLILTIHADYTLGQYNLLSAGVGFSVR
jgi:hypothetical protein